MDATYIRGFFDRQCSIDEVGRAIVLTASEDTLLRQISIQLRVAFSVPCTLRSTRNGRAKLRISGREALRVWKEQIGFSDPDKREKLDKILASYRGNQDAQPS